MDTLELLRHETTSCWTWLDSLVRDVTHDAANWQPPGSANSIAATYAHAVIAADVDINRYFLKREPIICNEPWKQRVGLSDLFPDNFQSGGEINWLELRAYGSEVERFMDELVGSLTMTDLDLALKESFAEVFGEPAVP